MPTLDDAFNRSFGSPAQEDQDPLDAAFDRTFGESESAKQLDLQQTLAAAVRQNPEHAAKADRLSRQTGLPTDVVARNLMDVELQEAVNRYDQTLKTSPKLAEYLRYKPWKAGQFHDDFPPLTGVESTTGALVDRTLLGTARDVGVTALKGTVGLPQSLVGIADIFTGGYAGKLVEGVGIRFADAQEILDQMYSPAQQRSNAAVREAEGFLDTLGAMLENPSTIATTVGESVPQMLGGAALGRTIVKMAPKVAPWLAAALGEGIMGAGASAESSRQESDDGLLSAKQTFGAVMSGGGTALFGAVGGKVANRLGLGDIDTVLVARGVDQASAKTLQRGFVTAIGKAGISEGLFEELPQSVQEQLWQNWANDRPLGQGVGAAAAQGLLAGLAMGGGFQAVTEAATRLQSRIDERALKEQETVAYAAKLQDSMAAAAQSKLRERNPETFRELVADMSDGATVYVDAQVLAQAGPELAEALPAVAEQLNDSATANSTVEVPVADILTLAPGTPLEQLFLQNARRDPDAQSLADTQAAAEQGEQFIKEEADRVLQQAADQAAWQQSSATVQQTILEQLNATGRFTPDVNEAYATLQANFFSTMAARTGMTPEQMYQQWSLKVAAKGQGGNVLNATRPGALTVEGFHYSNAARPVVSTAMFGTGLQGNNRDLYLNAQDQRLRKRAYFYVDKGTGINPESGVGGIAQKAQLTNVYDADADPLRLKKGGQLAFESAVLDAGFSGYLTRMEGTQSGNVIMLGDQAIQTEAIGPAAQLRGQVVPAPQARESLGRDVIVDALQARKDLPAGSPSRQMWNNMLRSMMPEEHAALQAAGVFEGDQNESLYKSDLIKAFEAATEAPVYGQSATIRRGTETLKKYGLKPGKKYKTREVAAALEARQRAKYGTIAADDRSPEALANIAKWMQAEVEFAMDNPESSGVGWYSEKFRRALDTMAQAFPELATDKVARDTMTALIAITSDGQKVVPNFAQAMDIYGRFREGGETAGKFTTTRGHQRQASIDNNLAVLQRLYDQMGAEAMHQYLMQEKTISELKKLAKANGGDLKSDYQAHIKMPMAAVEFGPKLGAFYANLMGAHGYLTMDRWWSRTFNRYRGTLLQAPTRQGLDRFKELLGNPAMSDDEAIAATVEPRNAYEAKGFKNGTELEKAANTIYKAAFENLEDSPFNATDRTFMLDAVNKAQKSLARKGYNLSVADIQAILWYYEKRLYGELGARQTADISYEEAAQRVVAGYAGGSGIESLLDDAAAAPGDGGAGEGRVPVGEETFDEGDVNGELEQAGDRGGRYSGGGLAPLEGAPDVRGAAGPDPRLVAVAEQYARDNGIELRRQAEFVEVDPERATRIAQAYAEMQHAPNDPKVKAAYEDLIRQTRAQYDALVAAGYEFTFFDDTTDPYQGNPWNAMRDLRANQRMAVYGTYAGFGVGADLNIGLADPAGGANLDPQAVLAAIKDIGGEVVGSVVHASSTEPTLVVKLKNKLDENVAYSLSEKLGQEAIAQSFEDGTGQLYGPAAANWGEYNPEFFVTADGRRASETLNPLLADTGLQWPDQNGELRPVKANDLFRAVHDAFGHGMEGAGFRAEGEENAWQAHIRLFTGSAKGAITSETRGQNSWLNFGPYGETNRTAKVEDTVFADQKTGLMPEWTWTEGVVGDMAEQGELEQSGDVTQTPEFQAWFGDSKVVDENGQPLVVYHGTAGDFEVFDMKRGGAVWDTSDSRGVMWFSTSVARANAGARDAAQVNAETDENWDAQVGANVMPVYLRVVNPYRATVKEVVDPEGFGKTIEKARKAGHDGVIMPGEMGGEDIAVFRPEQIKSATGNDGSFDANDPSILSQGPRGTFNPQALLITLNENADLSTFLHESGHFFLEVLADMASQSDAPQQIRDDMKAVLKWFGVKDLATWNKMSLNQKRPYHERWAESFEQYLFEGKAPTAELQPLFRRFRSWLVNVYKSLTQFMRGRDLQVSDEIRQVFDRLIATDEQIAQAEEAAGLLPDFEATNEAIEKLQARSLRDLKWTVGARNKAIKALQKEAATLRKGIEAEVRAEVEAQPLYAAMKWLKKGEMVDPATGDQVKAEKGFRLSTEALAEMYPETMLGRPDLAGLKGMTAKGGLHPDIVADMFGFESGDALVRNVLDAEPIASVIEGMTDQRMLERHGDLSTPEAIEAAANEAVHNEARARSLATELKSQAEMMNPRQDTGRTASNGRAITVNAITAAAKQFAANIAARRRIKDLRNAAWQHRSAEARAGKRWQQATAAGNTQDAVQAKRDQVLNNATVKALQDAQVEAKKILEFFKRVTKGNDEKVVKGGRDPDVVNAMRAILAAYDVAPRLEKSALEYMDVVSRNDPAMYGALKPGVDAALFAAKPLPEMTMEELRGLNDELRAMWALAKRSRQMEVDGNLLDLEEAADELLARMETIGIPAEIPGERGSITDSEERGIKLKFAKAILSRVEQWAERLDGKFGGPFLRLVFQPVKDAADRYRTDRTAYRKKFTALLQSVAPVLPAGPITAPELGGYTFGNARDSGMAEVLHAILHTGNDSNKRKLLLGRGWAAENEDGTLDTGRWDAFLQRLAAEGKLTSQHYDFAQGVWDLLEEMKPLAQETHRKVFGRYFAEVTANEFTDPFGVTRRGGYVPAQTDARIVRDAKLRELAEGENESMAYAFPSAPSGFTKSRVEYNKPLLLDLRALAQHMDKVLLFAHMQGAVTDVRRLLTNKRVSYALDRLDPGAYEGMLIPWLNRSAKQIVETPVAGDRKLSRFLSASRSRAGMALMFANLSNTFQQVTGFSTAAIKVKPSLLAKAMAEFTRGPKVVRERVAEMSPFMKDRMLHEVAALNDVVEEIMIDPTMVERGQAWTQRHAYFMQSAVDNTMSPIIWQAAFNQASEQGMSTTDAVRFADGVIRQTQGSTLPEDVSRFETGPAYGRLFTQFVGYFNMLANTNATAMKQIVDEVGLRKGAGKLLYVALTGMLVPIWVAEAIAQAMRGGPDDEDDDGYLDDWLAAVFGFGTVRGLVATVPGVAQVGQLVINRFNDNPADDKFSLSPAVSMIESSVGAPFSVYKAIADEGSAQKALRDTAAAATLLTGLPFYAAARPLGYAAGVAQGKIDPTGPVDFARGLATGTASAESRTP